MPNPNKSEDHRFNVDVFLDNRHRLSHHLFASEITSDNSGAVISAIEALTRAA